MDTHVGIMDHVNPQRCLSICLSLKEGNISPRPRKMQPGNQDDFFHVFYPEPKPPSKGEPGIDMLDHPAAKIAPGTSIQTLDIYWK